jgi:hypothetical protein
MDQYTENGAKCLGIVELYDHPHLWCPPLLRFCCRLSWLFRYVIVVAIALCHENLQLRFAVANRAAAMQQRSTIDETNLHPHRGEITMIQSAQVPVFDRKGHEIGVRNANTVNLYDGTVWHIIAGNVYAQPNDDFIGLIRGDVVRSFTSKVLYSFGEGCSDRDL